MEKINIIPDSSFYICFLDDIKETDFLLKIIQYDNFKFFTGLIIKEEIEKSSYYFKLEKIIDLKIQIFKYYDYGEILRPFFSVEEIKEGEHEVIVISYILYLRDTNFIAIIDDVTPRNFIQNNFPEMFKYIEWTINFLKKCYLHYKLYSKEEIISILQLIQNSKFRVKKEIIENIIDKIKSSTND